MSIKCVAGLILGLGLGAQAWAQDSVFLTNGNQIDGTIIQQNDQQVVLQLPYGTVAFDRSQIAKIVDQPEAALTPLERGNAQATTRFPRWSTVVAEVAAQPWGANMHQVPATVMAVGDLPYVPYLSFKCGAPGKGGTINVYGDLDNPIAFEFGLSGDLATNDEAKQIVMTFAAKNLTANQTDSTLLLALDHTKDSVTHNGLKMEVSPPTATTSYGSWWLTVSFPAKISAATIKLNELSTIAVPKTAIAEPGGNTAAWSAIEMQQAQTIAAQSAAVQAADAQAAAAQNAAAQAQAQAAAASAAAAQAQNNDNYNGGWNVYNTGGYVYPRAYVHDGGAYAHPAAYHPSYRR